MDGTGNNNVKLKLPGARISGCTLRLDVMRAPARTSSLPNNCLSMFQTTSGVDLAKFAGVGISTERGGAVFRERPANGDRFWTPNSGGGANGIASRRLSLEV